MWVRGLSRSLKLVPFDSLGAVSYSSSTMCSKKTCDHDFDDKLNYNCPFTKFFGTLITKTMSHQQVFLFSHLTYLVQLLYLGKLISAKIEQKKSCKFHRKT